MKTSSIADQRGKNLISRSPAISETLAAYLMRRGTGVFGFGVTGVFLGFFTSFLPLSLLPMFDSFA